MKKPARPGRLSPQPALLGAAAGVAVFLVGTGAESFIIRAVSGSRTALEWISDAIISFGVAGLTYLWLHLRESRSRLLEAERAGIVRPASRTGAPSWMRLGMRSRARGDITAPSLSPCSISTLQVTE
jgi:hypothetical protein